MAALRFITGDPAYYNLMARGVLTSSSADALYPLVNVKDGDPSKPFKFGSAGADLEVKVDLSLLVGSNMDVWVASSPTGWTKTTTGSSTVTEDTVIRVTGSSAAFFVLGGVAELRQNVVVRAGQKLALDCGVRVSTGVFGRVFIQNRSTGKWLNTSFAWQSAQTHCVRQADTSSGFVFPAVEIQVESFLSVGADTCQLQITLDQENGSGNVWFDDVYLTPLVDFFSIHGHNQDPGVPLLFESSDNNSSWVTKATVAPSKPSFYGRLSALEDHRWWRLKYSGTPLAAIYYGEIILGQVETALRPQLYDWPTRYVFDQIRTETEAGNVRSYKKALDERRAVKLEFNPKAAADVAQLRDEWARRSFGGHYPMIVLPDDTDPSLALHCRMTDEVEIMREFLTVWSTDVVIAESGFPTVTG